MLWNILQGTGRPPPWRNTWSQMPVVPGLSSPTAVCISFTSLASLTHEPVLRHCTSRLSQFPVRKLTGEQGQSQGASKCQSWNLNSCLLSESRHAFSILPAAFVPAKEEACRTVGFFFCSVGSRLEEAGRKVVIYTQLCIGSNSSAFSDPEGLTVRISQKYDHWDVGFPLQV